MLIDRLIDESVGLIDAAAENVSRIAAALTAGRATLDQLGEAVDLMRAAESERDQLIRLRPLLVNGRSYSLRTVNVRGEV